LFHNSHAVSNSHLPCRELYQKVLYQPEMAGRAPVKRKRSRDTHRSLPKKGSDSPAELRTICQGHPNAPLSSASLVLSFRRCLHGALFAFSSMSFTSASLKLFESTWPSSSGLLTSRPSFHIPLKMFRKTWTKLCGCASLIYTSAR
jgi:hypothetical protein